MTKYFGKLLVEKHGLISEKDNKELSEIWNSKLESYNAEKNS